MCDKEPGKSKSQTKQPPNILPPAAMVNGINDNKVDSVQQNSTSPSDHEQQIRRDQSQRASHLIGQYLLQGWALIDQTCPNDICYGVSVVKMLSYFFF